MEYFNGKFTDCPIEYFLKFIVIPVGMGKAVGNKYILPYFLSDISFVGGHCLVNPEIFKACVILHTDTSC